MSIRHAEYLKEEILSKMCSTAACIVAFLINEKVYQPLARSDFGKVASVICIREEMPQVICQEQRMDIFQYTSSKKFQLVDVRIEENNHPESSPTYALFLVDNADHIFTVNYHESLKDAQANHRMLKQLLVEQGYFILNRTFRNSRPNPA